MRSPAFRLALGYFCLFGILGMVAPFWPLWLAQRGMGAMQIGVLLALAPWMQFVSNLGVGQWAARRVRPRRLLRVLAVGLVAAYVAFGWVDGFAALLVVGVVAGGCFAPMAPLLDAVTLSFVRTGEVDYGRSRFWGSIAFIVVSSAGGAWLVARSDALVLPGVLGCAVAFVVAARMLPEGPPPTLAPGPMRPKGSLALLARPDVRRLVTTMALLHGSHAMLYAFGSQSWRDAGIPSQWLGWLWAEGTMVEALLFFVARRWLAGVSAPTLLVVSGLGGVVRWSVLAVHTSAATVVATQGLHAATFACMHLGGVTYIRDHLEPEQTPAASTLVSSIAVGLSLGTMLPLSGWMFRWWGTAAFWPMSLASAAGLSMALTLRRPGSR